MTGLETLDRLKTLNHLPELSFMELEHLKVICIQGPQAIDFLQGQLTCDVIAHQANQWSWGAHCDAKGKMVASFRIMKRENALYLLVPQSIAAHHEMHLKKYAVFHQVEIHTLQAQIIGVCGHQAIAWLKEQSLLQEDQVCHYDHGFVMQDHERAMVIHCDASKLPSSLIAQDFQPSAQLWQGLEILSGYPLFEASYQGQFIPQMLNLDSLHGISLTKGCYIGQETVARMTYRGGNHRGLFILTGTCTSVGQIGDAIEMKLESGYRKAGDVLQIYQEDHHCVLTLVLRKDIDMETEFRFATDEESQLKVFPCPYPLTESK